MLIQPAHICIPAFVCAPVRSQTQVPWLWSSWSALPPWGLESRLSALFFQFPGCRSDEEAGPAPFTPRSPPRGHARSPSVSPLLEYQMTWRVSPNRGVLWALSPAYTGGAGSGELPRSLPEIQPLTQFSRNAGLSRVPQLFSSALKSYFFNFWPQSSVLQGSFAFSCTRNA